MYLKKVLNDFLPDKIFDAHMHLYDVSYVGDKIKLIVDTDIGSDIDDTLCLSYLLKQPRCDILGITTCSSEPQKRAEIADSVCSYLGKKVPIYVGRKNPLLGNQKQTMVHQYPIVEGLKHKKCFSDNAIDFMRSAIEKYPGRIVILAIGPLTNIGALFAAYPNLANSVKIALMGGSFFDFGRAVTVSEWNIANDPYAAQIVFNSGAKILTVSLDLTLLTKISVKEFLQKKHSKAMEIVAIYAKKFAERTDDMYFHDVIPAMALFAPEIIKVKKGIIKVDVTETLGRTDFYETSEGNVELAYDLDIEKFFEIYKATTNA